VADKIRFHLDEHIHHTIAKGLRQRDIDDVTTTVEAELRTLSDEAHRNEKHFGIVYYSPRSRSISDVVTFLVLMHEILTPGEMIGRVEYL